MQIVGAVSRRMSGSFALAALIVLSAAGVAGAAGITINSKFPGGNVLVQKIEGNTVNIAPDLRGDSPWFYWCFEAEAAQPGRVTFVFPSGAGAQISMNGPAVSLDEGKTWAWLGMGNTQFLPPGRRDPALPGDTFFYDFTAENKKARFSVGIPYLQSNLDEFIQRIGANPNLTRSVLANTRSGRPVALWQIGQPGPGVIPVLVSARHHACEAMASYVLEGFLQEALSDSPAGVEFRKKYVLYAIPIVDADGVEAGDQGKGRKPHDHNRDYGQEKMIYPEVIALVQLAKDKKIELALDFHCPTLRMDIHQGVYFSGIRLPHIGNNVAELTAWMDEERPPVVTSRERDYMDKPGTSAPRGGMAFSNYFAYQDGVNFAATLETPYTQQGNGFDGAMGRQYGQGLLRAWVRTEFIGPKPDSVRSEWDSAKFVAFKKSFTDVYLREPAAAETIANTYLNNAEAPALYRIEANNLMGAMRFRQRKFAEAFKFYEVAMTDVNATANQRATAASQRAVAVCAIPEATLADVAKALDEFAAVPYPSPIQESAVCVAAATAYETKGAFDKALVYAQRWVPVSARYDKGKSLNRVADLQDKLGQKDKAIETRKVSVAILTKALDPIPVGIMGPMMAADLYDALCGIPTATLEEKQAAAIIVRDHKVSPAYVKARIPKAFMDSLPEKTP